LFTSSKMKIAVLLCLVAAVAAFSDKSAKPIQFVSAAGILDPRTRAISPLPKIIGGENDIKGLNPHQISLQLWYQGGWFHLCGGSIVAPNKIVTAAHCLVDFDASELRVVAGEYDLSAAEGTEQAVDVASAVPHPRYNPNTIDFDFGVIRLASDLTFNQYVGAIKLNPGAALDAGNCINTGWGNTRSDGGTENPAVLQRVQLSIVSHAVCEDNYSFVNDVTNNMICAGEAGKGSCNGDSGGPLVCDGDLHGIVSWGVLPCAATSYYPSVFSSVAAGREWLEAQ